jgi:hypothetical protein|tara:strand:+ start:1256 stop:1705 length:450 start_codon:yes stop_codon:yes gene_type:complete
MKSAKQNATKKRTRKRHRLNDNYHNTIIHTFFELLLTVKMFHWNTKLYSAHSSSDDYYSKLNTYMDKFIEVYLGRTGKLKVELQSLHVPTVKSNVELISYLSKFKKFLLHVEKELTLLRMPNSDLLTLLSIRDDILSETNQLIYLLNLK